MLATRGQSSGAQFVRGYSTSSDSIQQSTSRSNMMASLGNLFGGGGGGAGAPNSIFDFKVQDATGGEVDLSSYKDTKKAFLIVNVASK